MTEWLKPDFDPGLLPLGLSGLSQCDGSRSGNSMNVLPPSIAVGAILACAPTGRIAHKGYFDGRLRGIGPMLVTTSPGITRWPPLPVSSPLQTYRSPALEDRPCRPYN